MTRVEVSYTRTRFFLEDQTKAGSPGEISRIVSQALYRFAGFCRDAAKAILGGSASVTVA
jgi:hypothetical protein